MPYSERFKQQMVAKMAGPRAISASALAKEVGVSQPTLSGWLRRAKVGAMAKTKKIKAAKRPQDWTAAEKLGAVREAIGLAEEELGAYLRGRGLKQTHLDQWRQQMLTGLEAASGRRSSKPSPEARRIRELEKELDRKEKALAEAAALLVLKKKAEAIWGAEAENTPRRNGK